MTEKRRVKVGFYAVSIRPPRRFQNFEPGDVIDECVCVGPKYRFRFSTASSKFPESFECETAELTDCTEPVKPEPVR